MNTRFWAKTGSGEFFEDGSPKYHPVICHLADTAAVAMEIMRNYLSPVAIAALEKGLGLSGDSLIRCCGFLAGCHDLGKVSPAFQFQVSEVGKALVGEHFYDLWLNLPDGKTPHGTVTAKTMPEFLLDAGLGELIPTKQAEKLARKLAIIVGGHHGFFPSQKDIDNLHDGLCGTSEGSDWQHRRFAHTIFQQLQKFVGLTNTDLPTQCDNAAAMILAGLTTVSDWIASNPDEKTGFPYANDTSFDKYVVKLLEKANRALTAIGWTKTFRREPLQFTKLFPQITEPRALQNSVIATASTLTAPCLILVEASMGEGKTEAALYLADHLQHQAETGGFYIGLPTQATSNAMWERVRKFLGQRYPDSIVNLTLSHSAAALREDYQQTICRLDQVYDEEGRPKEGKVAAGEWHTARKRTLLSPYGVGTVDQALMGAVRSRHQFVRLFGLAGRTVILDEIHAYDLYTSTLLERFLEWLALLGSPVIALSATLPADTRRRLVNAYATGCGCSEPELPIDKPYPRLTAFTPAAGVDVTSFPASPHVTRTLTLRWVNDKEWAEVLKEKLVDGGCAAVICSTVGRSQEVFERLKEHFTPNELGLFHGRFLFTDRECIEKDCITKFGKPDKARVRPHRYVLVATQVIEQSLDLDFDLMISDLAPVDLLLQRSGRLHRHAERKERPTKLTQPTMWLISPNCDETGKAQFTESGFIYNRHILLRTWLALRKKTFIQLPDETDELIESVYQIDASIPQGVEPVHQQDWEGTRADYLSGETRRKIAEANNIKLPSARGDHKPCEFTQQGEEDDDNTIAAVTRLGEKSVTVIFVQQTPNGLILPVSKKEIDLDRAPDLPTIRTLLEHSTRISKRGLVEEFLKQKNPDKWTSALLRHCRYVILSPQGKTQVGKWELFLDAQRGVVIETI
ncbi:CRISPR-associated helicase/endonuclease Cas3 [Leptolyngbya sp. 'hensonii']|uniref:CRISPR-associated helicase/endonuclease Cas3 n=1 Tax=Leptolyngbya sp. 'hensonii' TaxID=1922337 RepID=UPI00094FD510|nr:CRISPR-associated helicase/endonuclease Cas3 [Leptolyngbya sp. 'hensonii']OLP18286.1 CRISPR-associated helicase/endonuclease Cas3 [Leptolyngbya sp. 'hensonii']